MLFCVSPPQVNLMSNGGQLTWESLTTSVSHVWSSEIEPTQTVSILVPYKVKTQYVQILNTVDTSI